MILEIRDIKLSLGGRPILKGVSLDIDKGQIYGLLGPNGAGKSTTIAAALGLLRVEAGSVRLFGANPASSGSERLRANVGVLPEQNGLYEWMTAAQYLGFFADLYRVANSTGRFEVRMQQVGLDPHDTRPISTYSRGMKQRLALARALINRPRLLVLDEPTNGLDPRGRREMHDVFLELASTGTAILLCTHLLDDVERLCTHVGIIVDGRTSTQGPIRDVEGAAGERGRYRLRLNGTAPDAGDEYELPFRVVARDGAWILVDVTSALPIHEVWREAVFRGWPIVEIEHIGGGLEDVYLDLTYEHQSSHRRAA